MSTLYEFDKKPLQNLRGRNGILFLSIIAHVILLGVFLIPDPYIIKVDLVNFGEYSYSSLPRHFSIESDIVSSRIIIRNTYRSKESPLSWSDSGKVYPLNLYNANRIYRLVNAYKRKVGEYNCCFAEYLFGEIYTPFGEEESFEIALSCDESGKDFERELSNILKDHLQSF